MDASGKKCKNHDPNRPHSWFSWKSTKFPNKSMIHQKFISQTIHLPRCRLAIRHLEILIMAHSFFKFFLNEVSIIFLKGLGIIPSNLLSLFLFTE